MKKEIDGCMLLKQLAYIYLVFNNMRLNIVLRKLMRRKCNYLLFINFDKKYLKILNVNKKDVLKRVKRYFDINNKKNI